MSAIHPLMSSGEDAQIIVSVVIPARNEERYIATALRSVEKMDYPRDRLECVVVDNGSEDGTATAVCTAIEHSTISIRLIREAGEGVARAKNAGAATAGGDILVFVDADSRAAPNLARAVASSWRAGFLAGSIRVVADGGSRLDRGFFRLMEFGKAHFGIRAQMLYCDRELFSRVGGFDPALRLGEDVEFLKRVQRHLRETGGRDVVHLMTTEIATSPRRLTSNHHLGMLVMFCRWLLAFLGLGRTRRY